MDEAPEGKKWLHEIKFDGYRILAFIKGEHITLKSRNRIDWTTQLMPIAKALKILSHKSVVLDGEVVVLDSQGKSDFQFQRPQK